MSKPQLAEVCRSSQVFPSPFGTDFSLPICKQLCVWEAGRSTPHINSSASGSLPSCLNRCTQNVLQQLFMLEAHAFQCSSAIHSVKHQLPLLASTTAKQALHWGRMPSAQTSSAFVKPPLFAHCHQARQLDAPAIATSLPALSIVKLVGKF